MHMANRYQNHQSESQRYGNHRPSDEDDSRSARDYDRDFDRDYGQGRGQRGWRDTSEESGSTGRSAGYAGYGDFGQGDYDRPGRGANTGQNRYGQTGYGQGGYGQGSHGQPNYGQDYGSSGTSNYGRSNFGSGRADPGGWREPYGEGQQYGSPGGFSQGQHRGKGPKNYQRSDERVKEMLCERLHDDPDIDASEVTINVQGGKITLEGTVDSRRTKNAIEDVAEQIGSQDVQNNLRVQKQGEYGVRPTMTSDNGEQAKQKRN
jgi:hypothetical protein